MMERMSRSTRTRDSCGRSEERVGMGEDKSGEEID
jgi:hypothetical protein